MKVDAQVVAALLRLRDPSLDPFVSYLRSLRGELLDDLLGLTDPALFHRQQGRVMALDEVLKLIDGAEKLREKLGR